MIEQDAVFPQRETTLLALNGHSRRTRVRPLLKQQRTLIGIGAEWLGR
jgi:hypothetical protein